MANISLKDIQFPGLNNVYKVPEVDNTLTQSGEAADAKKTGDEITSLKQEYNQLGQDIGENTYYTQSATGIVSNVNVFVGKLATQKTLLRFDLQNNNTITVSGKLKNAINKSSYFYIQDANGNNIISSTSRSIPSGTTSFSFEFTPTQNYTNCTLKYTVENSSTDVDFEYISVKMKASASVLPITMYSGTLVSEGVIQNKYAYPVIYKADSINFKTSSGRWSGAQLVITDNIAIGETIRVSGQRGDTGNDFTLRIDFRDSANQRIGSEHYTYGNSISEVIPDGTAWIEITFAGCWGTAVGDNTSITFTDVEVCYSAIPGNGANEYSGQQIILTDNPVQKNRCEITRWKNFLGTEIEGLADYNLYKNQSMAIYGGYVFLFQEAGSALILDYETKGIISESTIAPTTGQHHNSAQFTDIYYDSDDEFPLLLTSRCGNSNRDASDGDECQIYRVTRTDDTFTFTLINRIFADVTTKGSSWGIDNVTNQLYMLGAQTAWWETGTHLPLLYAVWNIPTLAQIKSGSDITLNIADCIAKANTPDNFTFQGLAVHGGVVYVGASVSGGQYVYAVDVFANRILSKVPLTQNIEVEGVAVYNEKIYVSQKRGTDTTGTNPCEIYEIAF